MAGKSKNTTRRIIKPEGVQTASYARRERETVPIIIRMEKIRIQIEGFIIYNASIKA